MKKGELQELKAKTKEELVKRLKDVRMEIAQLSLAISMQKEPNTAQLKTKKKEVTRILTFLSQAKEKTDLK